MSLPSYIQSVMENELEEMREMRSDVEKLEIEFGIFKDKWGLKTKEEK